MAAYFYKCRECSEQFGAEHDPLGPTAHNCPKCGCMCRWIRRGSGELPSNAQSPEYYSDGLGVGAHQIAEAKQRFPHHEFDSSGRMLIKGQRHKDKVMRELGFVEYTKNDLRHRE